MYVVLATIRLLRLNSSVSLSKVYKFVYSDYKTRNVIVAGLDEYWNYTTHVGTIIKSANYLYYTPAANVAWTLTEEDGKRNVSVSS